MSVMKCFRKDCKNVMCTRYSRTYGYLCDECYNDLLDYLVNVNWHVACIDGEYPSRYIKAFLNHPKGFKFSDRDAAEKAARILADGIFKLQE